jgi:hypothetical protein
MLSRSTSAIRLSLERSYYTQGIAQSEPSISPESPSPRASKEIRQDAPCKEGEEGLAAVEEPITRLLPPNKQMPSL